MNYRPGQHKKFSQQDKDRSDPLSRKVSSEFLTQDGTYRLGVPLVQQKEMFGAYDYQVLQGTRPVKVECEHKLGWTTNDGSFYVSGQLRPTVDVSGRKWDTAELFVMLNLSFDALCTTRMANVLAAPLEPKDTYLGTREELFYKVPVEQFQFYMLSGTRWRTCK